MKITYRIPTKEAFAFVEVTQETPEGSSTPTSEIREVYENLTKAFLEPISEVKGLAPVVWRQWIDEYLATGTVVDGADTWAKMSDRQKWAVNEIKLSRSRKGTRGEPEIN